MLLFLLVNLTAFSQVIVLSNNNDTTICFELAKSRFLLKSYYKAAETAKLYEICQEQKAFKDSILVQKKIIIDDYSRIMKNQKEMISLKDKEIVLLNIALLNEKRATRRQKLYKWIAIGAGGALSGYLGFKYITK